MGREAIVTDDVGPPNRRDPASAGAGNDGAGQEPPSATRPPSSDTHVRGSAADWREIQV